MSVRSEIESLRNLNERLRCNAQNDERRFQSLVEQTALIRTTTEAYINDLKAKIDQLRSRYCALPDSDECFCPACTIVYGPEGRKPIKQMEGK